MSRRARSRTAPPGPGRRAPVRPGLALAAAGLLLLGGGCGRKQVDAPEPAASADLVPRAPAAEAQGFRVAPGFRVELAAAEPLVSDPVALAWDDSGRLYAAELSGRVVVLADEDGDGAMDRSDVFLEGLGAPRALAVLSEGVLVAAGRTLWLCRDTDGDRACDERRRVARWRGGGEPGAGGLVTGLDGWIYDAGAGRRFRFVDGALEESATAFDGPRALAFDDAGRLYTSDAHRLLAVDLLPARYLLRHPATDPRAAPQPGVGVVLVPRADDAPPPEPGGLAVDRGLRLGEALRGDVFVAEPAAHAVLRLGVKRDGVVVRVEPARSADPGLAPGELLASGDERFRPRALALGPDGALYVADRYRGPEPVGASATRAAATGLGRIWRLVREGERSRPEVPDLAAARPEELVALLDHPTGWVRDHAQRCIVRQREPAVAARLRGGAGLSPLGRLHALHALAGMGRFDRVDFQTALADGAPQVRAAALRLAEPWLGAGDPGVLAMALSRAGDGDPRVRLQLLLALGEVPAGARPLEAMLALAEAGAPAELFRAAFVSGLAGREVDALALVAGEGAPAARAPLVEATAAAALLGPLAAGASESGPALAALLDAVAALPEGGSGEDDAWRRRAALRGIASASDRAGFAPAALPERPALFAPEALAPDAPAARELARARRAFTWPGDEPPPGTHP